jgi:hypothetical protein
MTIKKNKLWEDMIFSHSSIFGTQSFRTFPNKTKKQNMFIRVPIKRPYITE